MNLFYAIYREANNSLRTLLLLFTHVWGLLLFYLCMVMQGKRRKDRVEEELLYRLIDRIESAKDSSFPYIHSDSLR